MGSVFRPGLLEGKHAFITGGGSGIGLRIAERFAEHKARVTLLGRNPERLRQAVDSIVSGGGSAAAEAADVRQPEPLERAFLSAAERSGPIDILICGAAGNFPAAALNMSPNGFKSVVDIDLLGTFNSCRIGYAHLRKPGASILCISATHAFTPMPLQAHVCAAKSGVDMLAKVLAVEWGPAGVRVNCVTPGPVDGTEGMRRLAPTPEARDRLTSAIPLGRFAAKDEIADIALFLSSEAAAYVTGAIWVCDGGSSAAGRPLPLD